MIKTIELKLLKSSINYSKIHITEIRRFLNKNKLDKFSSFIR